MIKALKISQFANKQIKDIKLQGVQGVIKKFLLLIKYLIRFLFNILSLIPCLIIRLLSPWIIIRIERISSGNFGDFVWMTSMYYCKKKLKIDQPQKFFIDLLYLNPVSKIYNKQIEKMWKRKIRIYSSFFLDPIRTVNRLIPGWRNHIITNLSAQERDINNLFEKYKPLDFLRDEEIKGKKILNQFGLKEHDKFVCFAVRDVAYQEKKISSTERNWSYHDFRHTDINNFMLAAEELTKRGYFVFRMGVIAEKKFISKNPKIIDYANSNLRSDFMDVYLGAHCSFCLSTGYGFEDVPIIFRKPIAHMIQPLGTAYTHNEKYLILTKHHINKKNKREMSLSEIFSSGAGFFFQTQDFEKAGIELKNNTPEEIRDLVLEMAKNIEFKNNYTIEDDELQNKFKSLYLINIKKANFHEIIKDEFANGKRNFHKEIKSRYSIKFLNDNKKWLN